MEAYFITRGKNDEVETLIKWMSTAMLPMKMTKGDGSTMDVPIECMIRPIQLWSFVFPKEHEELVTNSFNLWNNGSPFEKGGYDINPKIWALRKLLGAREFKEPKDKNMKLVLPYPRWKDVNILGVGIRDDGEIAELTHERI